MEFDDQNPFSQENLYGDNLDDIIRFLNMNTCDLLGDVASGFQSIIHKHIEDILDSRKSQLPSFGEDFEWLNTTRPLSFDKDLGKKVYIMDFFTYCCINCIHILPYLKKVENEFVHNSGFTVIGVHSPKFPNEKHLERVREAVIRNDIKHPILNDSESKLWKTYGISCWPTVFIVGPAHILLFVLVGEAQIEKLSFLCHHILKYFESCAVELDSCHIPIFQMKEPEQKEAGLLFPGNVSTNGDNIVVSDTGHNRLLLMSRFLEVEETIGSGIIAYNDGPFNSASFNSPHGTVCFNNAVYVADTGNHSIRKIDLEQKIVSTVFKNDHDAHVHFDDSGTRTNFLSPWDVCVGPKLDSDLSKINVLYIAVAGSHQIWALDLESDSSRPGFCVPFAGSGKEENRQNLYRFKAGFAQPSGITYSPLMPDQLFVADSESSTIKSIALKGGGVKTIVGGGRDPTDLFQFGDQDGSHINVKLQHPMSVCVIKDGTLAITDTYNHKIKFVNVKEKQCLTLSAGVSLCEPSCICIAANTLLVADTNNHRIIPIPIDEEISEADSPTFYQVIETYNLAPQDAPKTVITLDYDGKLFCHFKFKSDSRYEFNEDSCHKWDISFKGNTKLDVVCNNNKNLFTGTPSLILKSSSNIDNSSVENLMSEVTLSIFLSFCDKKLKVCCSKEMTFKIIVHFSEIGFKAIGMNFIANVD